MMSVLEQSSLDERLAALIESRPEAIIDPYPLFHELLEDAPVHHLGPTVVLSRYDDVKRAVREFERMSTQAYRVGSRAKQILAGLSPDQADAFHGVSDFEMMYISRSDGNIHGRLRDIAMRPFGVRRMTEMRTTVRTYLDALIDDALQTADGDVIDMVSAITQQLPVMVICTLLNVPLEDAPRIKAWSGRIGKNRGGVVVADLMDAHAALAEFREYVYEILDNNRRNPQATDLVTAFMGAEGDDRLSADELMAQFVVLLFAGSDTTNALMANGLLALLERPDQWQQLVAEPDAAKDAVEELLRWVSPVQFLWRVTVEAMTFGGVEIPPDTTVMPVVAAANRDPRVFSDPDAIDIRRRPREHITFGYGPHFCLGNVLARMEGEIFFSTVARRFPEIALAVDPGELEWYGNAMFRTTRTLPVALGPDRNAA
jgi:cytochrome P450